MRKDTFSSKLVARSKIALANVLRFLLPTIVQFLIAKITLRNHPSLWGEVVEVLIYVQLFAAISSWGTKEYVLREYSRDPKDGNALWHKSIASRLPLVLLFFLSLFIFFEFWVAIIAGLWLLASFVHQSFDTLILFMNRIRQTFIVELCILLFVLSLYFLVPNSAVSMYSVLLFLASTMTLRVMVDYLLFQTEIHRSKFTFSVTYIRKASLFTLLGISGFLFSKIDLFIVDYFLDNGMLSRYQLFISMFVQIQAIAGLLFMPFNKQIYRLAKSRIPRLVMLYGLFGVMIAFLGMIAFYLLGEYYLFLNIPMNHYVVGAIGSIGIFFALPIIHMLYGERRETIVLMLNLIGFLLNAGLSILLIRKLSLFGVITATSISQTLISLSYFFLLLNHKKQHATLS